MLPARIKITEQLLFDITSIRNKKGITAKDLSLACGQKYYWITNIENEKTTTMTLAAAKKLYSLLYDLPEDQVEPKIELDVMINKHPYVSVPSKEADLIEHLICESEKNDFNKHQTKLKNNLHSIIAPLLEAFGNIDFSSEESLLKEEAPLQTLIQLLSTPEGQRIFKLLGRYPLHKLEDTTLIKLCAVLDEELIFEYTVNKDNPESEFPYLFCHMKDKYNDLFG